LYISRNLISRKGPKKRKNKFRENLYPEFCSRAKVHKCKN